MMKIAIISLFATSFLLSSTAFAAGDKGRTKPTADPECVRKCKQTNDTSSNPNVCIRSCPKI